MAQPRAGHLLIEQGEIGRVKNRISRSRNSGHHDQCLIVGRGTEYQACHAQGSDATEQDRPRTDPVDHEAGQCLTDSADQKEHGDQKPALRVAQTEVAHQPRKKRRQQ